MQIRVGGSTHLWTFDPCRNLCRFHWQKTRQSPVAVLADFMTGQIRISNGNKYPYVDICVHWIVECSSFNSSFDISPIFAGEKLLVGGDGKAEGTLDHAPGFDHQQTNGQWVS